jgi:Zn finger protein HypA/HybF involved in hydrogenase expression
MKVSIPQSHCIKCGHSWPPRGKRSKYCPNCHLYKWVRQVEKPDEQARCKSCDNTWVPRNEDVYLCPACRSFEIEVIKL